MSRLGRDYLKVGFYTEVLFVEKNIRFIAINNNIDSANQMDCDFTPFLNLMNEFYARDTSKKIKAVMKAKGESGKHLTTIPPYGYMKNPDNPNQWVIDEDAAEVVKKIFHLCLEGYGPAQIAKQLQSDKIIIPFVHWKQSGIINIPKDIDNPYKWSADTVSGILEKQEYIGNTVNFKTHKQSYKSKKKINNPKEQQLIFENTHEPIIDVDTREKVQELRKNRRRPTKTSKTNMFSGIAYCTDCGEKLYYCTSNNFEKRQDYFVCSTSRKNGKDVCNTHYIWAVILEEGVLAHLKMVIDFISLYEDTFREVMGVQHKAIIKKELSSKKRAITKAENRINELDRLFTSIYEDKISGVLTESRFKMLAEQYEQEQSELKEKVKILSYEIEQRERESNNVERFVAKVHKYFDLQELTPDVLNDLVKRVEVYVPEKINGRRTQHIDIYYDFIGLLPMLLLQTKMNNSIA